MVAAGQVSKGLEDVLAMVKGYLKGQAATQPFYVGPVGHSEVFVGAMPFLGFDRCVAAFTNYLVHWMSAVAIHS